jgi:hypothetical protein
MMNIMDPTIAVAREHVNYVPRPLKLRGLRIGLIENTKKNAEPMLRRIAEQLAAAHGMTMEVLVHKPQRSPLNEGQITQLKGKVDFVIAGIGD